MTDGSNCPQSPSDQSAPPTSTPAATAKSRLPTDIIERYEHPDFVPVLTTTNTKLLLAKVWRVGPDGKPTKIPTPMATKFAHAPVPVGHVRNLLVLVRTLGPITNRAVIRGSLLPQQREAKLVHRRTTYREGNPHAPRGSHEGRSIPPFFRSAPLGRRWICLDIDDLPCPAAIDPLENPTAAQEFLLSKLPPFFADCSCVFQWSGSMGVGLTAGKVLKAHVWFWLKEPVRDDDLAAWAKTLDPASRIDTRLFNPVQVHYTAHPQILDGLEDPFGPKSGRPRETLIARTNDVVDLLPVVRAAVFAKHTARSEQIDRAPATESDAPESPELEAKKSRSARAAATRISTNSFLRDGAHEGGRNEALFRAACDLAGSGVPRDSAEIELLEAAAKCTPPMDPDEARSTIESAFSSPRAPAKPELAEARQIDSFGPQLHFGTELWFARNFIHDHSAELRWVGPWGTWMKFVAEEGRWVEDHQLFVLRLAQDYAECVVPQLEANYRAVMAAANKSEVGDAKSGSSGDAGNDDAESFSRKFQSRTAMENALKLARADHRVAANVEQWDRAPWLLCVANGTIDLRTGELRKSRPDEFLTKKCPAEFHPDAAAPVFEAFLERVQPDPAIRDYLQRLIGYSAIGEIREHVVHFFHGSGANGKSTFIEAIRPVFGDYFTTAPPTLLMEAKGDRHPTEMALLHGKRLVVANETPAGGRLNEGLVKALSGGDRVIARRMREDFWSFDPSHKIVVCTNHRPRIVGVDEGVWRRIRLVPWAVTIPIEERDSTLPARLRAEASGILGWIVRGAKRYLECGLAAPATVLAATESYRTAEDSLADFVAECLVDASGSFLASRAIHDRYRVWADEAGIPELRRLSMRALSDGLAERGKVAHRTSTARGFLGLRLREANDDAIPERSFEDSSVPFTSATLGMTQVTQRDAVGLSASCAQDLDASRIASAHDAVTQSPGDETSRARMHTRAQTEKPRAPVTPSSASRGTRDDDENDDDAPPFEIVPIVARPGSPARNHAAPLVPVPPVSLADREPPHSCRVCGGTRFGRLRSPGKGPWVCQGCHPAPAPANGRWDFAERGRSTDFPSDPTLLADGGAR